MRTYYTLGDAFEAAFPEREGKGVFACDPMNMSKYRLDTFINKCCSKAGYGEGILLSTTEGSNEMWTCWSIYIYPRFWNQVVCYTDTDETDASIVCAAAAGRIYSWMYSSAQKYSLLIKNYLQYKSDLMNEITAQSEDRFNDTPQNSGDYSDDAHNTNITKHKSSTLGGTVMSRLNEIEDNIKQLYTDWSNEFRKFIIWSA